MTASDLVTDTSVEMPDEWPMRTAASFNPFITSGSRGWAKYYADHGDLFMRITNLKRHRIKPDLSDRQHVALPASEKEGLRTGLRHGDILISITADIGIIGYVDETVPTPAYINQHVACLRLPSDQVSPKFVAYYLASSEPQRRFIEMTDVGAKTGINLTTVGKLTFPCPSLVEQEAIAEALSDADALIEGLERLIAKKRLIKRGAMQDLLTAKRRLPGFSGEWVETSFGQCFQFLRTGSASRSQLGANLGVGYIHYGDIHGMKSVMLDTSVTRLPEIESGQVETLSRVRDGDLVIADASEDLADVGKSVEVRGVGDKQIVAGLHTFLLRGNQEIVADGFKAYIQFLRDVRAGIENIATGSSVYGISKKNLAGLKFRVPPVREQAAIGQMFADMDAEIQILDTRLEKARQVKEGMMQNLLTGRIRLV